jgi:hypothetical protein
MTTQGEFWSDTGQESDAGPTCETLLPTLTVRGNYNRKGASKTSGNGLFTVATLSPEDSHASPYHLPAGVRLNVIRAGSGRISHAPFAYYDRATRSLKTCQGCFQPEDQTYSETLPKWGTMRSGQLYQRVPLVRPINGSGFSLLPTLLATTNKRGYSGQAERSILCHTYAGGPINPEWCEHLMAFPIGFSELPD